MQLHLARMFYLLVIKFPTLVGYLFQIRLLVQIRQYKVLRVWYLVVTYPLNLVHSMPLLGNAIYNSRLSVYLSHFDLFTMVLRCCTSIGTVDTALQKLRHYQLMNIRERNSIIKCYLVETFLSRVYLVLFVSYLVEIVWALCVVGCIEACR